MPLSLPAHARRVLIIGVLLFGPGPNAAVADGQASGQTQTVQPLGVEAMLSLNRIDDWDDLALSADGRWVAFTLHNDRTQAPPGEASLEGLLATGNRVGYVDCDVWVTNTATGETHNVTRAWGSSWGPVWSPDGRRLAFYSDRDGVLRVWVWDRATGRLRRVSNAAVQATWGASAARWTPDGRALIVAGVPDARAITRPAARASLSTPAARVYRFSRDPATAVVNARPTDTAGFRQPSNDLVLLDAAKGVATTLVRGDRVVGWWLSPNGRTVAFTADRGTAAPTAESGLTFLRDVITLDLPTGRQTVVASVRTTADGPTVSFSPDSRAVAYTSFESGPYARGDCFVALLGELARNVTPGVHEFFGRHLLAPIWDVTGGGLYIISKVGIWHVRLGGAEGPDTVSRVLGLAGEEIRWIVPTSDYRAYWSPDGGRSLVVLARDTSTLRTALYRVDLERATATLWYAANKKVDDEWLKPRIVGGSGQIVFVAEDLQDPAELWAASTWDSPHQLTHLNPSIDRVHLPGSQLIDWHDSVGRLLRGVLMLPAGYMEGRRYPLVVFQHPGEFKSTHANQFGGDAAAGLMNLHLLTTRGYAVLLPDVPTEGDDTTLMGAAWRAIAGGIDRTITLGVADPERLGILGHSEGGYGVLGTIIATPRFHAAVALSGGAYDFAAQFLQLQPDGGAIFTKTSVYQLGGSLWERPATYVANSPVFFLDRVRTPLLLVSGAADETTRPAQSAAVFVGLRTLGREVEYAVYPGENHVYLFWTRTHQEDVVKRILEWFDRYLKGPKRSN
jgi:dipeptidyl aminopeptidase/acylaminoacyl peptidase